MTALPAYARIRVSKRAVQASEEAWATLDRGLVGHVGFLHEDRPMVVPMAYARSGETLYLHGASKTRIVRLGAGAPLCLTVTLVDGLVVARSGFHCSMNYRSVMAHGRGRLVTDPSEAAAALDRVVEHLLPGRSREMRAPTRQEMKATGVVALDIEALTMKRREGPPVDDEADLAAPGWAGVLPVATAMAAGVADAFTPRGVDEPPSLAASRARFAS